MCLFVCVSVPVSLSSVNYLILLNLSLSEAEIQLSVIALRALWELRRPAWAERSGELSGLLVLLRSIPSSSLSLFFCSHLLTGNCYWSITRLFSRKFSSWYKGSTMYSWYTGSTVCSLYMGNSTYSQYAGSTVCSRYTVSTVCSQYMGSTVCRWSKVSTMCKWYMGVIFPLSSLPFNTTISLLVSWWTFKLLSPLRCCGWHTSLSDNPAISTGRHCLSQILSHCFWVQSTQEYSFFIIRSIHFSVEKQNNFVFSFPLWMPLISFSCLIALARTSSIMLVISR